MGEKAGSEDPIIVDPHHIAYDICHTVKKLTSLILVMPFLF